MSCLVGNLAGPAGFGMARSAWTSHQTMTGFMISYLSQSELAEDH
jgi:hypothetical protein